MIKRFFEWMKIKSSIEENNFILPITERDICWLSIGENIGHEICGKGDNFLRPCLILKVLSEKMYLIVPITSKDKTSDWYVKVFFRNKPIHACLHQIRVVDFRRVRKVMGRLSQMNFELIKNAFNKLYMQ